MVPAVTGVVVWAAVAVAAVVAVAAGKKTAVSVAAVTCAVG